MTNLIHRLRLLVCLLYVTAFGSFAAAWEIKKFDLPQSRWPGFQDVVIDETGAPWVLANQLVHYFDGDKFVALEKSQLSSGLYLTRLYGDPERGAYLTQKGEKDHEGKIYRLKAGRYERITTFYYDSAHNRPGIYVSKNGRLFNWGQTFLAVYNGAEWTRIEGHFGEYFDLYPPVICDFGADVYFYSTHDNRIYGCNAANEISVTAGPALVLEQIEERKRKSNFPLPIAASAWNGDRIVVLLQRPTQVLAFNVRTKELIDVEMTADEKKKLTFEDAFETNSGSVWLTTLVHTKNGHTIFELTPEGKLNEIPALQSNGWANARRMEYPDSVLETDEGVMVFGLHELGIVIYRDGKQELLNWKNGFYDGSVSIQQGLKGELWLPYDRSGRGIVRLTLGPGPPPTTEMAQEWAEYHLVTGSQVWKLSSDTIAMFDIAHPNQLCRITAGKATFQQMPGDVSRIQRSIVDDRGHLFVQIIPGNVFEISPGSIDEFESMEEALAVAVKGGAKRFQGSADIGGIFLTADNRLWYLLHNSHSVNMLADDVWSTFQFRDDVHYLFESADYGAIICTEGGKLYRYNTGQMEELDHPLNSRREQMLGPRQLQPFDKQTALTQPNQYYPVLREPAGSRLYFDIASFEQAFIDPASSAIKPTGVELPKLFDHVVPARSYGAWLMVSQGAGAPYRIFNDQLTRLKLTGTPLSSYSISDIVETANGDTWFTSAYGGDTKAFQLLQSQITIQLNPIAETCGRELEVSGDVKPDRLSPEVKLFTTINGELQPVTLTSAGNILFRFPSSGDYRCSIGGIRLGATTPEPAEFTVKATVLLPETQWDNSATEATVTTLRWSPPVTASPSEQDHSVQLAWRVAGEPWRLIDKDSTISLIDRAPGEYDLEFRATEDEYWHDPSPITVKVHYAPNYGLIVHDLAQQMISTDHKVRAVAIEQLQQLGANALPQLKLEIEAAEKAIQMLPNLRHVQQRIEQAERRRK